MNKDDVTKLLQPIADTFKVAVTELWKIFVRHYVVRGVSELFTALILIVIAGAVWDGFTTNEKYWAIAPLLVGVVFIYDAIQLVGNPQYYALDEIIKKVKNGG